MERWEGRRLETGIDAFPYHFLGGRQVPEGVGILLLHDVGQVMGDVLPHAGDEFFAGFRDLDHDFAAIIGGLGPGDVTHFFQFVDHAGSSRGRVSHFFCDIGHGEEVLVIQVGQKEKLGIGDTTVRQLGGEVQDA